MGKQLSALYCSQQKTKDQLSALKTSQKNIESSPDFIQMMNIGTIDAYSQFSEQYPEYNIICCQIETLRKTEDEQNRQIQTLYRKESIRNEKARIKRSGLSETEYRFLKAKEMFGYTCDFTVAGFLLPDGNLLNFDPYGYGQRTEDHAIVTSLFADPLISSSASKAIHAFMKLGAIRLGNASVEICSTIKPTAAQYKIISDMNQYYGPLYLDITDDEYHIVLSTQTMFATQTIKEFIHI